LDNFTISNQTRTNKYSSFFKDTSKQKPIDLNCLLSNPIDVIKDNSSNLKLIITKGTCVKNNILIEITENELIDIRTPSFLFSSSYTPIGYHYVVLNDSNKESSITILPPCKRNLYSKEKYIFLKCFLLIFNGKEYVISELFDHDPSIPLNRRIYDHNYAGVLDTLPEFDEYLHKSKFIYIKDSKELFYGTNLRLEELNSIKVNINTYSFKIGDLVFIDPKGIISYASESSLSNCIVIQNGIVKLYGKCYDVPVETGKTILTGDSCYLSKIEEGKVTNIKNDYQKVGTCIEGGDSKIIILFKPASSGKSYSRTKNFKNHFTRS
jgi:hypothetical protein